MRRKQRHPKLTAGPSTTPLAMRLREAPLRMTISVNIFYMSSVCRCSLALTLERLMSQVGCELSSDAFKVSLKLVRTRQSGLDVRKYILRPYMLEKAGA